MVDRKAPPASGVEESSEITLGKLFDSYVPESVKRALFTGAGMLFMTEEGIRKAMSEFNLPREAVNYLIKQSEKGKEEVFSNLQREISRLLSRANAAGLIKEVLDETSLDVHTTITIRTKRENDRPVAEMNRNKTTRRKRKRPPKG